MTEYSPDPKTLIIGIGTRIIEQAATAYIRNAKFGQGSDSPSSQSRSQASGCVYCTIHERISHGHALARGLRKRLNPDGSIPPGLGGTLKIAQDEVSATMDEIPQLFGTNEKMDQALARLGAALPGLQIDLAHVSSKQELDVIVAKFSEAEDLAYAIPELIYRQDAHRSESPQPEKTIPVTKEDEQLLSTFRDLREGKITRAQAMHTLSETLKPENSNGA